MSDATERLNAAHHGSPLSNSVLEQSRFRVPSMGWVYFPQRREMCRVGHVRIRPTHHMIGASFLFGDYLLHGNMALVLGGPECLSAK